eukprot:1143180-Pelagomonas_calceolata.AAC.4
MSARLQNRNKSSLGTENSPHQLREGATLVQRLNVKLRRQQNAPLVNQREETRAKAPPIRTTSLKQKGDAVQSWPCALRTALFTSSLLARASPQFTGRKEGSRFQGLQGLQGGWPTARKSG